MDDVILGGGVQACPGMLKEAFKTLNLVSAIFYQIFVFPPNDSPSKTMKYVFYFIKKALFVLEIFKLL